MGIVVFNPNTTPVNLASCQVDGQDWKYVENEGEADLYLEDGRLVIADAPADVRSINPRAQDAFAQLRKNRKRKSKSAATIPSVRDTELSETTHDTETEA